MDPLSIAGTCVALTGTATKLGTELTRFVMRCRESKDDLAGMARQISSLKMALELLSDDLKPEEGACRVPDSFRPQLNPMLDNCRDILTELGSILSAYTARPKSTGVKWAVFGKDKVLSLEKQLDAHVKALNVTLSCVSLCVLPTYPPW